MGTKPFNLFKNATSIYNPFLTYQYV